MVTFIELIIAVEVFTQDGRSSTDKYVETFSTLNTYQGLLKSLFLFGNTLELLYVGGMVYEPPTLVAGKELIPHADTLIPLYVEFRAKKCHYCQRPIVDYKRGLFCSNIFQGLQDLNQACYKFVCKDCL